MPQHAAADSAVSTVSMHRKAGISAVIAMDETAMPTNDKNPNGKMRKKQSTKMKPPVLRSPYKQTHAHGRSGSLSGLHHGGQRRQAG